MHLAPLIRDLAVILGVAGLVALLFQRIRQPVVLGYVIAGFLVGPHVLPSPPVSDIPNIRTWADLGVAFLMFSLGLEFSFRKLGRVGVSVGLTACAEVGAMIALGYGAGRALGWPPSECVFLGAMLAIASTTIIVKALDELGLKTRRFAQMIFGLLIVEDLIAVLILVALTTFTDVGGFSGTALVFSAAKLVLAIGSWFLAGYFVVPRFVRYVGRVSTDEMLTIVALGLCLFLGVLADRLGYSAALGAFIMGSILSESTESHRIEELVRPLRDVFVAIFFVSVGMLLDPAYLRTEWAAILVITLALVGGKITATTIAAMLSGQTLRTAVQVGFGVAQIGEFSFIIAGLGKGLGASSDRLYPIAVAVSLLTSLTTPFFIRRSHRVAVALEGWLPLPTREFLMKYAAWTQKRRADGATRSLFYRLALRWFLNGIIVTAVFVLLADHPQEFLRARLGPGPWAAALAWGLATLISSPFLVGMLNAFRAFGFAKAGAGAPTGGTLFLSRFLALVWIGGLSGALFAAKPALLITAIFAAGLAVAFFRRLEASYRWFEERFMATFRPAPKSRSRIDVLRDLAPWDAYLVRIKVHPNSEAAGARLSELDLRLRFGVSVVAIQRGLRTLVAPPSVTQVFPKDELLVLGNDDQVEQVRAAIEKPPGLAERFRGLEGYELRKIPIPEGSPFAGKAIRDSGVREAFGGMVVGIERSGRKILNPESAMTLETDDRLWIVGETELLDQAH